MAPEARGPWNMPEGWWRYGGGAPRWSVSGGRGADQPRLRASHADRERVVTQLRDATTAGYLTLDELEERVASAYAARFMDELGPLVADIPGPPAPAPPPTPPSPFMGTWRWALWMCMIMCLVFAVVASIGAAATGGGGAGGLWVILLLGFALMRLSRGRRRWGARGRYGSPML